MRQELARLDLTDRGFNQTTVVASLARCQGILRALVDLFRAHGLNAGTAFYQCVGLSLRAAAPKR